MKDATIDGDGDLRLGGFYYPVDIVQGHLSCRPSQGDHSPGSNAGRLGTGKGHGNLFDSKPHHTLRVLNSCLDGTGSLVEVDDHPFPDPQGRGFSYPDDLGFPRARIHLRHHDRYLRGSKIQTDQEIGLFLHFDSLPSGLPGLLSVPWGTTFLATIFPS